jgi:hypothetical protein
MIFEEAPRPAGSYSHALVANGFAFVADQDPGEVPSTFTDQVRQSFTSCGQFSRVSALTMEPRSVGARSYTEMGRSSVSGDQEGFCRGKLEQLTPGADAIVRRHRMLRGGFRIGL